MLSYFLIFLFSYFLFSYFPIFLFSYFPIFQFLAFTGCHDIPDEILPNIVLTAAVVPLGICWVEQLTISIALIYTELHVQRE
jgi:hypothetical protein